MTSTPPGDFAGGGEHADAYIAFGLRVERDLAGPEASAEIRMIRRARAPQHHRA
jgi:hypothetical protein